MTWKNIIKSNKPRPPFYPTKERRMSQDDLFDEANRNMRSDRFASSSSDRRNYIEDFVAFRRRIFDFFARKNYADEDLAKFKESPALRNLHMMYGRMKGD